MAETSSTAEPEQLQGLIEGLPNICGWEEDIATIVARREPVFLPQTSYRLEDIRSCFAIALHMHQPMIPAGQGGSLVNNLQYMLEHPYEGDNYNAGHFAYCYGRIGDFLPELVSQGCDPRVMLDYTGTLLWGLQQMGRTDILDKLKLVTCDERYQPHVEWLGTFWGHSVADTLPLPDIKLQIQAWQHHFAAIFGKVALGRVRGFSLPERRLPQQPAHLYELVSTLTACGYQWMMVPRSAVETLNGESVERSHIPYRLITEGTSGETAEIIVFLTDDAAEAKLVAKMHPYYQAKALSREAKRREQIAPIVTQIADGENEGLMLNEFPSAF